MATCGDVFPKSGICWLPNISFRKKLYTQHLVNEIFFKGRSWTRDNISRVFWWVSCRQILYIWMNNLFIAFKEEIMDLSLFANQFWIIELKHVCRISSCIYCTVASSSKISVDLMIFYLDILRFSENFHDNGPF